MTVVYEKLKMQKCYVDQQVVISEHLLFQPKQNFPKYIKGTSLPMNRFNHIFDFVIDLYM